MQLLKTSGEEAVYPNSRTTVTENPLNRKKGGEWQSHPLWDFQIHILVVANQSDIVVANKLQKKALVIDVEIPSVSNFKKTEHERFKKY